MGVFGKDRIEKLVKMSDLYTFVNDIILNDENDKILSLYEQDLSEDGWVFKKKKIKETNTLELFS